MDHCHRGWQDHLSTVYGMAGVGETCIYVGSLAFAVDTYTQTKEKATCTGVKAYWKVPAEVKGVSPLPAHKIDFSSARVKKTRLYKCIEDDGAIQPASHHQKGQQLASRPAVGDFLLFSKLNSDGSSNVLRVLTARMLLRIHQICRPVPVHLPCLRTLRDPLCINLCMKDLQHA